MERIKLLIVDDQALMRDGLKTVLDLEEGLEVAGLAKNGREALEVIEKIHPHVVLLDIRMPELDGVETVRIIKEKHLEIKVIMLTTFNDEEYIMKAIANGANGYLLKDIEVERLVEAIKDAYHGKMIMPPEVYTKLAEGLGRIQNTKKESDACSKLDLSEREMEICAMMVKGFNNKQIAMALFISEGTVRNYISNIYSKIGMSDRTNAVLYLKENGIG